MHLFFYILSQPAADQSGGGGDQILQRHLLVALHTLAVSSKILGIRKNGTCHKFQLMLLLVHKIKPQQIIKLR